MTAAPGDPVRVLFIAGLGRSGSTLIDRALGSAPGVVSLGEIVRLWQRGLEERTTCGCGAPFEECEFWGRVGHEAFGGWDAVDRDRFISLQRGVDRTRFVPLMISRRGTAYQARREEYTSLLGRLFGAISRVSGAEVIVDSSKDLSTSFLMRTVPNVDLRVVHLVRDSRAVAYSWTKHVSKGGSGGEMDRYAPGLVARRYVSTNLVLHAARAMRAPMMRVRYEDFVADPERWLTALLGFAGVRRPTADTVAGSRLRAAPHHSVGGNPMRFTTGEIRIRLDEEWREQLPANDRRIVTAMTLPLLLRYGYIGRSSR